MPLPIWNRPEPPRLRMNPGTVNVFCYYKTCPDKFKDKEVPIGCQINPCPACLHYARKYTTDTDRKRNQGWLKS